MAAARRPGRPGVRICLLWQCLAVGPRLAHALPPSGKANGCAVGVPYPAAAYYISADPERHVFMSERLKAAGIRAVRVPAIRPPPGGFRARLIAGDRHSHQLAMVLRQSRCRGLAKKPSCKHALCCFMYDVAMGNCTHKSQYGPIVVDGEARGWSNGSKPCDGFVANFLSHHRALTRIAVAHNLGMFGAGGGFVLLLEDDTAPVGEWRTRYCAFHERHPALSWDVAKLDSSSERNVRDATQAAKRFGQMLNATAGGAAHARANGPMPTRGHAGFGSAALAAHDRPPFALYARDEHLRVAATQALWRKHGEPLRVPFSWGCASLLLHSSRAGAIAGMMEQMPIGGFDLTVRHMMLRKMLRVACADEPVFDPWSNELQQRTTIGRRRQQ